MNADQYQREAGCSLAGRYHGDKVSMAELRGRMIDGVRAGNALDQVKKALFYGKGDDIGMTQSTAARTALAAPAMIAGLTVQREADDAKGPLPEVWTEDQATIILHMALGKFTEAAEFLEAVLLAMNGEAPPDRINLLEEIGDGLWYDANALEALGSSFPAEMARNNAKLRLRFPEGFTEDKAINRNVTAERTLLEGESQDVDANAPGYDPAASHTVGMNHVG